MFTASAILFVCVTSSIFSSCKTISLAFIGVNGNILFALAENVMTDKRSIGLSLLMKNFMAFFCRSVFLWSHSVPAPTSKMATISTPGRLLSSLNLSDSIRSTHTSNFVSPIGIVFLYLILIFTFSPWITSSSDSELT
uniref:Uncharacterized protein n=1 Tax=Opuntia streptacantha TaxID=393608 RepID=A0A7C8Z8I3_OPUST